MFENGLLFVDRNSTVIIEHRGVILCKQAPISPGLDKDEPILPVMVSRRLVQGCQDVHLIIIYHHHFLLFRELFRWRVWVILNFVKFMGKPFKVQVAMKDRI